MGKRRQRRRGRHRQYHQNVWRQYKSRSLLQSVEDENEREQYRVKQKEHLQQIAELKQDLLSRTVLVGSVLPLENSINLQRLKQFMSIRFGPVQKCTLEKKKSNNRRGGNRFPRGRVQFHQKKDAEKVFDGLSLMDARKEKKQVRISCPTVGYKGTITVQPSPEYTGMVYEDLDEKGIIKVNTEMLGFGHWFPGKQDAGTNLPELEKLCLDPTSTWVEEKSTTMNPILSFDLERSLVELDFTNCQANDISSFEAVIALLREVDMSTGVDLNRVVVSFRFKDLAYNPMTELCQDESGEYYVIFSLKHSPRLSSVSIVPGTGWETRERLTTIDGVDEDTFGSCYGYRLRVSSTEINRLFINTEAFGKLQNFGLFRSELDSLQQVEPIRTEYVNTDQQRDVKIKLENTDTRVGLFLKSILDNQSCCWFDLMNDKIDSQDLIDLATIGDNPLVEKVSWCICPVKLRARLLLAL